MKATNTTPGTTGYYSAREPAARYKVIDAEYGVSYGAYRTAEEDTLYWRVAHFLFPFYTMTPATSLATTSPYSPGSRSMTSTA